MLWNSLKTPCTPGRSRTIVLPALFPPYKSLDSSCSRSSPCEVCEKAPFFVTPPMEELTDAGTSEGSLARS